MKENVYELRTANLGYNNKEEEGGEERRGEERKLVREEEKGASGVAW